MHRRRFLAVAAATACLPLAAHASPPLAHWRGVALGAAASLKIAHPDVDRARRALAACVGEIERLERVFSLYREDSGLARLNAAGRLAAPPADLVALLSQALAMAEATGGAFDPTVQPLWRAYADHFVRPGADPAGPSGRTIDAALARVGWRRVEVSGRRIALATGAELTLNGAAQGWITDRLTDLLRDQGFTDVLVNAGEVRAEGRRPDGRPWTTDRGPLTGALAVSSGDGTRFSPVCHHILDPRTGRSSDAVGAVSVLAPNATIADLASTAIAVGGTATARTLLTRIKGLRADLA